MRVGKVIVDPPPAMTLIKPAKEPTTKRRSSFNNSSIVYSFRKCMAWYFFFGHRLTQIIKILKKKFPACIFEICP
jgi:hypothetical protein